MTHYKEQFPPEMKGAKEEKKAEVKKADEKETKTEKKAEPKKDEKKAYEDWEKEHAALVQELKDVKQKLHESRHAPSYKK